MYTYTYQRIFSGIDMHQLYIFICIKYKYVMYKLLYMHVDVYKYQPRTYTHLYEYNCQRFLILRPLLVTENFPSLITK